MKKESKKKPYKTLLLGKGVCRSTINASSSLSSLLVPSGPETYGFSSVSLPRGFTSRLHPSFGRCGAAVFLFDLEMP
jgi:hypothetical protein